MSHIPQRKEKDCLNCGAIVQGKYCQECGQENVVPKETFWHMVTHFFYDITHFDSKFFETLKDLLFKPGFLSKEYMRGKRASYLHPIKMYVFTSAIFFLLFFSLFKGESTFKLESPADWNGKERLEELDSLQAKLIRDSSKKKVDNIQQKLAKIQIMRDTTMPVTWNDIASVQGKMFEVNISDRDIEYETVNEYDSIQKTLPKSKRDGWFRTRLIRKELGINSRYGNNPKAAFEKLAQTFLNRLPYMLFVSLPLFALILQLLYIRRKQFYYADHAVFTVHLYIFSFILLLVVFGINELRELTGWDIFGWIIALLFLALNYYLYKAMKVFYGQRRFKTFVKYLITAILSLVMMLILLIIFFFFSAYDL